jgi:signal transduction histidine kinase
VRLHGGVLEIDSALGCGSVFRMIVPVERRAREAA